MKGKKEKEAPSDAQTESISVGIFGNDFISSQRQSLSYVVYDWRSRRLHIEIVEAGKKKIIPSFHYF